MTLAGKRQLRADGRHFRLNIPCGGYIFKMVWAMHSLGSRACAHRSGARGY